MKQQKHLEILIPEKKLFKSPHFLILALELHRTAQSLLSRMSKNLCCMAMRTDLGSHQEMDCISALPGLSVLDRTREAWEVITGNVQTESGLHLWCVVVVGAGCKHWVGG